MNAELRRKHEMTTRALDFSRAHPDPSAGYTAALTRLTELSDRTDALAAEQRAGIIAARTATARKRELRRSIEHSEMVHLARVAESASTEVPELARQFARPRDNASYQAFRTAANAMVAEAQTHKELLVRHGLVEEVLTSMIAELAEFDSALEAASAGRRQHVSAGAELAVVVDDMVQVVRVLDGLNRYRFAKDAARMAAWNSATNILGPVRGGTAQPGTPEAGGSGDGATPSAA